MPNPAYNSTAWADAALAGQHSPDISDLFADCPNHPARGRHQHRQTPHATSRTRHHPSH